MKKEAISYAIIRFQPHVETEEFANIGIVLLAPRRGYLDFRLETKRFARVTSFFDTVEPEILKEVLRSSNAELKRIRDLAGYHANGQQRFEFQPTDNAEHLFNALTKDREGVIRFSDVRFAIHERPEQKLEELFEFYVRRSFVNQIYREGLLEKHLRSFLSERDIGRNFKPRKFSDGVYTAKFPFVEMDNEKPLRVIKPIYLGQADPSKILDHGNKWIYTINRLRKKLPDKILFAVEGPSDRGARGRAFEETVKDFRKNSIAVTDFQNEQEILTYASS